jgi:hypothetical protein
MAVGYGLSDKNVLLKIEINFDAVFICKKDADRYSDKVVLILMELIWRAS